jgi:ankyrin repeat protein
MKYRLVLLAAVSILLASTPLRAQESVCDLFSHLAQSVDGRHVVLTGDLIISKDLAVLGAADCDNRYVWRSHQWPTALSLRPSPDLAPEKLKKFQEAGESADHLRQTGKTVSARGSFSGRLRMVPSRGSPAELIFDSFASLEVEALPNPSELHVTPICELFQNLAEFRAKRIAVRGEFVTTMEGAWITGRCKGGFFTNGYRWPVGLTFGTPAYYSSETARLYEAKWPLVPEGEAGLQGKFSAVRTATFVGVLRMRSEYTAVCRPDGTYLGNGFGHLNGAAAELIVENVQNLDLAESPTSDESDDHEPEHCTPSNLPTLCASAQSLAQAASLNCIDRMRELLLKSGIDSKDGSGSPSLDNAIRSGNETIVKLLLQAGAPVNPERPTVWLPLFEAAFFKRIAILKLLLDSGAQVDGLDSQGSTYLASYGFFDIRIMGILLEAGANPNSTGRDGQTALMQAAGYGYERAVKVLIDHHAAVNLKDRKGRTALMHSCAGPYVDAIPLLLENGADPDIRDAEGKTALDLALISNNQAAIKLLSAVKK